MNISILRGLTITKKPVSSLIGLGITLLTFIALSNSVFAQGPIEVREHISIRRGHIWPYAVSGENLVFVENHRIYGHNLSTDTTFLINKYWSNAPDIFGNIVVWMDGRNGNTDIYGYYLDKHREFRVTTHKASQSWPVTNGNIVVWVDWRHGGGVYGNDIYGYNIQKLLVEIILVSASHER